MSESLARGWEAQAKALPDSAKRDLLARAKHLRELLKRARVFRASEQAQQLDRES